MEHLEEFEILNGFKFHKACEAGLEVSGKSNGTTISIMFVNDKHVAVDMTLIEGELKLTEPYAINDDFEAVDK